MAPRGSTTDIGAQLRAAREAKRLTIGTISNRTRVPARALAAIELNDLPSLPPHPFGRGFVRTYAEEVGLDPDDAVREYFAQFPSQPAPLPVAVDRGAAASVWEPSSRWIGMGTAVAILLVVVAAAIVLGRRAENAVPTDTVGTTGNAPAAPAQSAAVPEPAAQPGDTVRPTAVEPAVRPTSPQSSAITVVLSMSRPCWVGATADGQRTIYRVVQPGDRQTIVAEHDITLRLGDAGAVTWTINGRDAGTPGAAGAVRDIRITRDNAASVR